MKKALIALTLSCIIGLMGCDTINPADPNQLQALPADVNSWIADIEFYEVQVKLLVQQMVDAGTFTSEKQAQIARIYAEIGAAKSELRKIADAIASGNYQPGDEQITTIIKALMAANSATAAWNPYAPMINLVLGLALIVLGIFFRNKAKALSEVVIGNELFKRAADINGRVAFRTAQNSMQSGSTIKAVDNIAINAAKVINTKKTKNITA